MQLPEIIGVLHSNNQPRYNEVLQGISSIVRKSSIVAIEHPRSLRDITNCGGQHMRSADHFWYDVVQLLSANCANIIPVEDLTLWNLTCDRQELLLTCEGGDDEEDAWPEETDARLQELNLKRSIRLVQMSVQHHCSVLITGNKHTADLEAMHYPSPIHRILFDPRECATGQYKQRMKQCYERFGVNFQTDDWFAETYDVEWGS